MYSCCSRPVRRLLAPRITHGDLVALGGVSNGPGLRHATHAVPRARRGRGTANATADTIFWGGAIVPLAGPQATVEAIAVQDGRIVALGDRATVQAWQGPS